VLASPSYPGDSHVYPLNLDGALTNWGHELPLDHWWHVAVVNDGQLKDAGEAVIAG